MGETENNLDDIAGELTDDEAVALHSSLARATAMISRERLIAKAQWWAGKCTDDGNDELAGLLLDVAAQMKRDRGAE